MKYKIFLDGKPMVSGLTLRQAAAVACLDADEIAWAIEECGRCDSEDDSFREVTIFRMDAVIDETTPFPFEIPLA
jgi:hypothetical protein